MNIYISNSKYFNSTWHLTYDVNMLNQFEKEIHNLLFNFFNNRERTQLGNIKSYSQSITKDYLKKLIQVKLNLENDTENKYCDRIKYYFLHCVEICLNELKGCS